MTEREKLLAIVLEAIESTLDCVASDCSTSVHFAGKAADQILSTLPATGGEVVEAAERLGEFADALDGGRRLLWDAGDHLPMRGVRSDRLAADLRAVLDRLSASPPPSHNSDMEGEKGSEPSLSDLAATPATPIGNGGAR